MRIDHPPADIQEKFRQCGLILSTIIIWHRIKAETLTLSSDELAYTAFDAIRLRYHISHVLGGELRYWDFCLADGTFKEVILKHVITITPVTDAERELALELLKAVI